MLRGLNIFNQYSEGINNYNSMMNLMKTYAMIDISLEAFSLDSCEDIVGDGIDTYSQKLIVDFGFGLYKNGITPTGYDAKT